MIHGCSLGWASSGISISNRGRNFQQLPTQVGLNQWCRRKEPLAPGSSEQLHTVAEETCSKRCQTNFAHAAFADTYWLSCYCWICSLFKKCNAWGGLSSTTVWRTRNSSFLSLLSRHSPLCRNIVLQVLGRERMRSGKEKMPGSQHHQLLSALLWE